jgi:hypothetical protein
MVRKNFALCLAVSLSIMFFSTPVLAQLPGFCFALPCEKTNCPTGGVGAEEFVKALDAAYVRVLDPAWRNGKGLPSYWELQEDVFDKYVTVYDCYPYEAETPFPTPTPGGLLDCVLNVEKKIRFGTFPSGGCPTSSDVGGPSGNAIRDAIIQELRDHYNVPDLELEVVEGAGPGGQFYQLLCECVDMTDNVHALGAVTFGQLRRELALHTCTIRASAHVVFVRQEDWDTQKYRTVNDLVADPDAILCGGALDTHVTQSLVPEERTLIEQCNDIEVGVERVKSGECAAFFHWDPTLTVPGLRRFETGIVGGTPYWVKK